MAKRVGVGLAELSWVDGIGPGIEGCRASTDVDGDAIPNAGTVTLAPTPGPSRYVALSIEAQS